jgi:Sulfate permease family
LLKRWLRVPGILISVVAATALVAEFDLATRAGVSVLGPLPQGLPAPRLPLVGADGRPSRHPLSRLWFFGSNNCIEFPEHNDITQGFTEARILERSRPQGKVNRRFGFPGELRRRQACRS